MTEESTEPSPEIDTAPAEEEEQQPASTDAPVAGDQSSSVYESAAGGDPPEVVQQQQQPPQKQKSATSLRDNDSVANSSHGGGDAEDAAAETTDTEDDADADGTDSKEENEEEEEHGDDEDDAAQHPRLYVWIALAVFTGIALTAASREFNSSYSSEFHWKDLPTGQGSHEKYTLFVTSFTMTICILFCSVMVLMPKVINIYIEIFLLVLFFCLWGPGLYIIMSVFNQIAVAPDATNMGVVFNANLYFFTWFTFATLMYLAFEIIKELMESLVGGGKSAVAVLSKAMTWRFAKWLALLVTSLVVIGSSARVLYDSDSILLGSCGDNPDGQALGKTAFCKRTKFALAVGTFSSTFSLIMVVAVLGLSATAAASAGGAAKEDQGKKVVEDAEAGEATAEEQGENQGSAEEQGENQAEGDNQGEEGDKGGNQGDNQGDNQGEEDDNQGEEGDFQNQAADSGSQAEEAGHSQADAAGNEVEENAEEKVKEKVQSTMDQEALLGGAELGLSTFLMIFWLFGVGFITFGPSPGSLVGNLYFSTWGSFLLCASIFLPPFRTAAMGMVAAQMEAAKKKQMEKDNSSSAKKEEQQEEQKEEEEEEEVLAADVPETAPEGPSKKKLDVDEGGADAGDDNKAPEEETNNDDSNKNDNDQTATNDKPADVESGGDAKESGEDNETPAADTADKDNAAGTEDNGNAADAKNTTSGDDNV